MRYTFAYIAGLFLGLMMLFYYLKGIYFLFKQKKYFIIPVYFLVLALSVLANWEVLNITNTHLRVWHFLGLLMIYIILFLFPLFFLPNKEKTNSMQLKNLSLNIILMLVGIGAWIAGLSINKFNGLAILLLITFMYSFLEAVLISFR